MSAFTPNCDAPNCTIAALPGIDNTFDANLLSADRGARFLVEISAFPKSAAPITFEPSPNCGAPNCDLGTQIGALAQPELLTFSDHVLSFKPTDSLRPNLAPEARLAERVDIRTLFSVIPNTAQAGQVLTGDVELLNHDRWVDQYLADFIVNGRQVRLLMGFEGQPYRTYRVLETVYGIGWAGPAEELRLSVQDLQFTLDRPYQERRFGGTGGIEGDSSLTGVLKPRWIGYRENETGVLIDRANNVYMLSDSPIQEVLRAMDGGAQYTDSGIDATTYTGLIGASLSEGQYATALGLGLVRIRPAGGSPQSVVTFTARGDSTGGYSERLGDLMFKELRDRALVDGTQLDAGSFSALNGFDAGYYYSGQSETTFRNVVSELAGYGNGRIIADSKLRAIRLQEPTAAAASFSLVADEIVEIEPEGVIYQPVKKFIVRYLPNGRQLSLSEVIDPGTDTALKDRLQRPYEEIERYVGSAALRYGDSAQDEVIVETGISDEDDAIALLDNLVALWGTERYIYKVTATRPALFYTVGAVVSVTYPALGFENGRSGLIVERDNDYNEQQSILRILV